MKHKPDTTLAAPRRIAASDRPEMTSPSDDNRRYKRLTLLFRCAAVAVGVAETWAARHSMGADGTSYLDMGEAYLRGDWRMALSPHWSPLYSWLLTLGLKVLKPSSYWEFPAIHLVNLTIYLAALICFEFLLSGLVDYHKRVEGVCVNGLAALPDWAWCAIGYTLFIWTSFSLIGLGTVTPDMCVAAFAYLASGLVVRIRAGSSARLLFAGLGIALGFGYLAKAIFFPLAFIFLAITFFSVGDPKKATRGVLLTAAIFLAIAAPFMVALSVSLGRPTFGESGRFNYIGYVDRPDYFRNPPLVLAHPMKRIHAAPMVFEFSSGVKGAYPLMYNPEYWLEGYAPHFDLKGQLAALKASAINLYNFLFLSETGLIAGVIVLFWLSPRPSLSLRAALTQWHLLVPAVCVFGAYSLLHVDSRYIAPFVALVWLGILSGLRLRIGNDSRKLIAGVVIAIVVTMGTPILSSAFFGFAAGRRSAPVDWQVARALNQMGIQPGDRVAWFRRSVWGDFYWARLARIRIIAEIPDEEVDKFWASSPSVQAEVMNALKGAGAKAVITSPDPLRPGYVAVPRGASAAWHQLGNTDFYAAYVPR